MHYGSRERREFRSTQKDLAQFRATHDLHHGRGACASGVAGTLPALSRLISKFTLAVAMMTLATVVGGCTSYPAPGGFNPVKLLCTGDYDVEQARCTVPVDLGIGPSH